MLESLYLSVLISFAGFTQLNFAIVVAGIILMVMTTIAAIKKYEKTLQKKFSRYN